MTMQSDLSTLNEIVPLEFSEWLDETADEAGRHQQEIESAIAAHEEKEKCAKQELANQLEEARKAGREEVLAESEERLHEAIETERSAVAMACMGFAKARNRYFDEIESEVVRLALSIAERVLQREVLMDATLLEGVVRVALSKLRSTNGVVLSVPEEDVESWKRAMRSAEIQVQGDPALGRGDVALRSTSGIAELGVKAQMVEIERGFFDLLAKRPA